MPAQRSIAEMTIFQFHKGTIKTEQAANSAQAAPYFNSIKVRLKRSSTIHERDYTEDFNSIKVRLKLEAPEDATDEKPYFNSIKVRLKPPAGNREIIRDKFQFHKGTIKTRQQVRKSSVEIISIP